MPEPVCGGLVTPVLDGQGQCQAPTLDQHGNFPPRNHADTKVLGLFHALHHGSGQRVSPALEPANPNVGVEHDHAKAFQSASGSAGAIKSPLIWVPASRAEG